MVVHKGFYDLVYIVNWDGGFVRDFTDGIHINAQNIFSFQLVTNFLFPSINMIDYRCQKKKIYMIDYQNS